MQSSTFSTVCRVVAVALAAACSPKTHAASEPSPQETSVRVAIGTQDTTINCAAGGPLVRELHLLEKYLPRDGKYAHVHYDIQWENQPTGAQLNSKVLANQLDIVQMADFPSVLGATALKAAGNKVRALYIATLSGGIGGAGNAIVVPTSSKVQSLAELKGKKISVPFGSTAHAMLLRALQDLGWDPSKDVDIVTQTPEVAGSALKGSQIDAHAGFVPFGELFPFRGFARKIYDGSATGVTTTHGIQVRSDFAEKYPEIVVAYLKATLEADRLLREKPEELSERLAQWTGVDAEVYYAFHGPHGIQTRDYSLKPEYVEAIRKAQSALKLLKKVADKVVIEEYVDDRFIRKAAREFGYDYEARLKTYDALPFSGNAVDTQAPVSDPASAGQIWVRGERTVRLYSTVAATFSALKRLGAGKEVGARGSAREQDQVRVTFVHDRDTGNKLFADKAWYVRRDGQLFAFLLKQAAQAWAKSQGGSVIDFETARVTVD